MIFVEEDILESKFGLSPFNFKKNSASHSSSHRMSQLEGTTGGLLVQAPCSSRVPQIPGHRLISMRLLIISREGGSTAWNCHPENLALNLVLLTERNFFLHISDQSSNEKKFWNIIFNNFFNRHNVDTVQLNFSKALE